MSRDWTEFNWELLCNNAFLVREDVVWPQEPASKWSKYDPQWNDTTESRGRTASFGTSTLTARKAASFFNKATIMHPLITGSTRISSNAWNIKLCINIFTNCLYKNMNTIGSASTATRNDAIEECCQHYTDEKAHRCSCSYQDQNFDIHILQCVKNVDNHHHQNQAHRIFFIWKTIKL